MGQGGRASSWACSSSPGARSAGGGGADSGQPRAAETGSFTPSGSRDRDRAARGAPGRKLSAPPFISLARGTCTRVLCPLGSVFCRIGGLKRMILPFRNQRKVRWASLESSGLQVWKPADEVRAGDPPPPTAQVPPQGLLGPLLHLAPPCSSPGWGSVCSQQPAPKCWCPRGTASCQSHRRGSPGAGVRAARAPAQWLLRQPDAQGLGWAPPGTQPGLGECPVPALSEL